MHRSLAIVIGCLWLAGCQTPGATVSRPDWIVYRPPVGRHQWVRIHYQEAVPAGPVEIGVRPVAGPSTYDAVTEYLEQVIGYGVERQPTLFAATGQGDVIRRLGTSAQTVGIAAFAYLAPSVSPAGTRLLYACREWEEDGWEIWTCALDGGEPVFLALGQDPAWLDERSIVFVREGALWRMTLDGTESACLLAEPGFELSQPAVAPDGRAVVYVRSRPREPASRDLWLLSISESTRRQLTENPSRDDFPCWRRDAGEILFRSTRGRKWGVWRLSVNPEPSREQHQ